MDVQGLTNGLALGEEWVWSCISAECWPVITWCDQYDVITWHDHMTWSIWRDHMTWSIWYLLRFTPQQFLERTKKMGLEVGLVIDLTNTNRYYSPQVSHYPVRWGITNHQTWFVQEFPHSIRYHKIFCEGHVIPSEEVYRKYVLDEMGWIVEYNVCISGFLVFWKISCYLKQIKVRTYIHTYVDTNRHAVTSPLGQVAAVHCTHGVNRTGYLVCR